MSKLLMCSYKALIQIKVLYINIYEKWFRYENFLKCLLIYLIFNYNYIAQIFLKIEYPKKKKKYGR